MSTRDYSAISEGVIATEAQIQAAIDALATRLAADYGSGKVTDSCPLVLICVLKGAVLFTADLLRALQDRGVPCRVEFLRIASYLGTTSKAADVLLKGDLMDRIAGHHCIIVEDIVDSGHSIAFLQQSLSAKSPASLKVAALLSKQVKRAVDVVVDYACIPIKNEFVIGYGLDYKELYRGVRDIVVLKRSVYSRKESSL